VWAPFSGGVGFLRHFLHWCSFRLFPFISSFFLSRWDVDENRRKLKKNAWGGGGGEWIWHLRKRTFPFFFSLVWLGRMLMLNLGEDPWGSTGLITTWFGLEWVPLGNRSSLRLDHVLPVIHFMRTYPGDGRRKQTTKSFKITRHHSTSQFSRVQSRQEPIRIKHTFQSGNTIRLKPFKKSPYTLVSFTPTKLYEGQDLSRVWGWPLIVIRM